MKILRNLLLATSFAMAAFIVSRPVAVEASGNCQPLVYACRSLPGCIHDECFGVSNLWCNTDDTIWADWCCAPNAQCGGEVYASGSCSTGEQCIPCPPGWPCE